MTFKSHRQPLCRACGKPLRKHGTTVTLTLERTELAGRQKAEIAATVRRM